MTIYIPGTMKKTASDLLRCYPLSFFILSDLVNQSNSLHGEQGTNTQECKCPRLHPGAHVNLKMENKRPQHHGWVNESKSPGATCQREKKKKKIRLQEADNKAPSVFFLSSFLSRETSFVDTV